MNQSDENPLEIQIDHALAEYMAECDSGIIPNRESFLAKHAELREQLSELLSAADWIEQLAGPTAALASFSQAADGENISPNLEETLPHAFSTPGGMDRTLPLNPASMAFSVGNESTQVKSGRASMREVSQPVLPCQFGDYVLQKILGRGGMGVVYYGYQRHLERPVAIKMIRSGALASHEEVQRFYSEARSAAQLDHPNIVTVYQCGEYEGHHFFSMDYVAGTDLSKLSAEKPLNCKLAARYVRDVALAIQYAHDRGVLHRDLKPANVLVDENDMVRITDFGLAKQIGHETGLTATGAAIGTPSYMSPEQASGAVDEQHQATDIYSLGAILFTIVTGRPPFKADSVLQTIMQVIHRPAPMARTIDKSIDEDLETIIDVCLQKAPERRYASASALAVDLDRYLAGIPIQARPISQLRRGWYWLLGVPIFGAILDHRVVEPTEAHRWVQRGLISAGLLLLCAWMLLLIPGSVWFKNRMPGNIRIAAGTAGGSYELLAESLAQALGRATDRKTTVLPTAGSSDNLDLLIDGQVELALLQADAVGSPSVAVIAPLYYEAVHIIVDSSAGVEEVADLKGKRLIIGSEKTGSRGVAKIILEHAGLLLSDVLVVDSDWRGLRDTADADAAIVVSKLAAPDMSALLSDGNFQLLALPDATEFALDEPIFHTKNIPADTYPKCAMPDSGIDTVAITAYLATQTDTPNILVEEVLANMCTPQMVESTGILPADRAAHWQGLVWHAAARAFFQPYQ